jgi:hypothetical protein
MRRLTWFAGGVAAGAAGAGYAKRKVRRTVQRRVVDTASQLSPVHVARGAVDRAKRRSRDVADAVREGRTAMHHREDELKARRDGRVDTLDAHVGPEDQLLVDGQPVETGRVIVLRRAK